jgi:hypothetical protein
MHDRQMIISPSVLPDYLITYPEVPSFVRRTQLLYRVPRIIIKSVNITVFPHLYTSLKYYSFHNTKKSCSIQQTMYTEVSYIQCIAAPPGVCEPPTQQHKS